ncbi:MAG: hypothetical protein NTZ16_12475 [Verrucomicrobia bacterium]|nr:hypothetical protein [Verrucomicrobiota bacterium]
MTPDDYEEKKGTIRARLASQLATVTRSTATVKCLGAFPNRCGDYADHGLEIPLWKAIKCLYCGFYFCEACAAKHFGKTRKEFVHLSPEVQS